MSEILSRLMDSIQAYGPWSVFLGVIIESVIIPIPSPLVIMGAGFLLIHPDLNAWEALGPVLALIVLPGSVASTLGAYIGYGIGYLGGKPLLRRFERFLGFGWRDVEALEKHFHSGRVNVLIFFLRALPIFPLSLISAAAGLIRLPLKRFSFWTFCGTIPRCLFLGYLGWWIGETYRHVAFGIDNAETLVSIILIVAILALNFWIRARVRKRVLKRGSE